MTDGDESRIGVHPDEGRLGAFFGILVLLIGGFLGISQVTGVSIVALGSVYMFTPLVAGLVVCLGYNVSLSDVGLRAGRLRWSVGAVGVALLVVGVTLALSLAVPAVGFDPATDPAVGVELPSGAVGTLAAVGLTIAIGVTVNAVFAFGEEFGWRGYLLWELAPLGFWKASLAVGTVWGLWHAPLVLAGRNYPSFPVVGVAVMTVACIALSPLYTYVVIRAESVLAAAFFHGVFNSSAGIVGVYAVTNSAALGELVASPIGVAGVVACGLLAAGIAARGAPTLDRTFAAADTEGPEPPIAGTGSPTDD